MANYLYNGVELPELPEWDMSAYPYAAIITTANDDYVFTISSSERTVFGASTLTSGDARYDIIDGAWELSERAGFYGGIVWANYDLYKDGTLYLGATVPLPTIGKTWRYNGVELPALPEWDAQTYPYAVIVNYNKASYPYYQYELVVVSERPEYSRLGDSDLFCVSVENDEALCKGYFYMSEYPDEGWFDSARTGFSSFDEKQLNWSNSNILREDGSVLLQASQPIPVGTFPVPEVYVPYVNTAKNIFDVQCGKAYSNIAVAENQNYISVHFLTDDFNLVTYDQETTIYTAQGIAFVTYDKRTDKWSAEVVDNTTTPSEGSRYLSHWVWSEVDVQWNGATVFTNQEGWYYNAVKLPELPEWDKSVYPYAFIAHVDDSWGDWSYELVFTQKPAEIKPKEYDENNLDISWENPSIRYQAGYMGDPLDEWGSGTFDSQFTGLDIFDFVWSNYDLKQSDGTTYCPASEPVHVTYVVDDPDDPDDPDNPNPDEPDEPDEPILPDLPEVGAEEYQTTIGIDNVARKIANCYIGVNDVARKIKKIYLGVNGFARLVYQSGFVLGELPVGSSIFMNMNGVPAEFLIVHQGNPDVNIYDASCDGTWLLKKTSYGEDMSFGTNVDDFQSSDVRLELNDVIFFTFDANVQNLIKQVKIPHYKGSNTNGSVMSGTNGLPSKLFLLSGYEVGWTTANGAFPENEGAVLDYFKGCAEVDSKRSAYRDDGEAVAWWLRSTVTNSYKRAWDIYDGEAWNDTFNTTCAIRPALILPHNTMLDDKFNVIV